MTVLDLSVDGLGGWARLLAGTTLLLAPGVAAADRVLPSGRGRFLLAPVLSVTILVLATMLGSEFLGIPVSRGTMVVYAVAATVGLGHGRIRDALSALRRRGFVVPRLHVRAPRADARWLLVPVVAFVMLVHALPHVPGDAPASAVGVWPELGDRAWDLAQGEDYPYPIHVDEHIHLAWIAQVLRDRDASIPDPYTGGEGGDLLTLGGFGSERGFDAAVAAVHLLTDVPLAALFRFLPMVWSGYLASLAWYAVRPAPGGLAAAWFVGILPTSVRFLGPGFLVSSPFGLPWLLATLIVVSRATEARRFITLVALVWGAFFMHMVIGTLCVAVALLGMALRPADWRDRISILVAAALPLVWIVPDIWPDLVTLVTRTHTLPFEQRILLSPGPWLAALAVAGAGIACWRPSQENTPVRVLAVLAIGLGASLYLSIRLGHRSDATYSRVLFAFFLCLAVLAGHGLSSAARAAADRLVRTPPRRRLVHGIVVAAAALAIVPTAMTYNLQDPYYRVHDDESWRQAADLAAVAAPGEVFLGHPWQAPVLNAASGAYPHSVLYPGERPVREADYVHYLATGGDPGWFEAREIRYVVGPRAPGAPHDVVAEGVYRIR